MARGKASVQLYDNVDGHLAPTIDGRAELSFMKGCPENNGDEYVGEGKSELSEQIVGQLKVAYDGLLNEPIPDHLKRLLADLCKAEDGI